MNSKILVTYATRYGSTQEVAEAIPTTLREGKVEVRVRAGTGCGRVTSNTSR